MGMAKKKLPEEVLEFFRKQGRKGGKKGGKARAKALSPEQRSAIARKAGAASIKVRQAKAAARKAGAMPLLRSDPPADE
jgi:general stress protein YciG